MKIKMILYILMILIMMNPGYAGDEEPKKKERKPYKRRVPKPMNHTVLDIYHATDPLSQGHEKRINNKLRNTDGKSIRASALYWIQKMCNEWPQLTGLKQEETNEILERIYSETRTNGPDGENKIREKLLEVYPDLRKIHPEYIRSVVHDWYRSRLKAMNTSGQIRSRKDEADLLYTYFRVKYGEGYLADRIAEKWKQFHPDLCNLGEISLMRKANDLSNADPPFSTEEMEEARKRYERVFGGEPAETTKGKSITRDGMGKIRLRNDEADLLYTYRQVKFGNGSIHERLAEKWKQFHPHLTGYSKLSLFNKANKFQNAKPGFSEDEMEAAKMRYEGVFGPEEAASQRRMKWRKDQTDDLLYLTDKYRKKEIDNNSFNSLWQLLHPELAFAKRRVLSNKVDDAKRKNITLTPEEAADAEARLTDALNQKEQSRQKIRITFKGKSLGTKTPPKQEHHQQTSDLMIESPPHLDDLRLTQAERNDLEMWMNERTLHHPPTPRYLPSSYHHQGYYPPTPSLYPGETFQLHFSPYPHDSSTWNAHYERGSSSHPPDNPHP